MTRAAVLRRMPLAVVMALAGTSLGAMAQQAPPSGGQLLRQVPIPAPAQPSSPKLTLPTQTTPQVAEDQTPFAVRRIEIRGNTALATPYLHALVAASEGQALTLGQLQALAQRVTDAYRAHGYPLARAIVPPQTLSDGVVILQVIEARYDGVRVDNHSRVSNRLLQATLAPLHGGLVEQGSLDRQLLLLDDLPGVRTQATLSPGTQPGTSDLDVRAESAPWLSGTLSLDNEGNRYTGRSRIGGNLFLDNPLGQGDQLSLSALTSGGDLHYGRLGYELALNGRGTRIGASYSALGYRLGDSLSALQAHGIADQGSAWIDQVFVRQVDANLSAHLQVDDKHLHDDVDAADLHNHRHLLDWTASLYGDRRDGWAGGGITQALLSVTRGQVTFDDAVAKASDAATLRTQGRFTRWNGLLSRLQTLTASTRLYLALNGQYSRRNLDSAEQFLLGGSDSLRGYDASTLAGASGYLATLELRHDLDWAGGAWQGSVFADHGGVWLNPQHWPGQQGPNHARLSSAGLGLNWSGAHQWVALLQLSQPIGATPALAGHRPDARAWLQLSKGF